MKVSYLVLLAVLLAVSLFITEIDAAKGKRQGKAKLKRKGRKNRRGRKKDCGSIPHVMNGHGLATDSGVQYACQLGYRLEGTNVITCVNGRWTVAPRCVRELCPPPPNAPFAKAPAVSSSGTMATYICLPGYQISAGITSATITCSTVSQSWPAVPVCNVMPVKTCGAPPSIADGMSQVSGNMAIYTCNAGFVRKAGTPSTITCSSNRWMYSILPACVRDPTTTPPPAKCMKSPPCGDATVTRGAVADSYDVGSKITYTCVSGYRLTGSNDNSKTTAEISCKSDGKWESAPSCEKVDCGQPPQGIFTVTVSTTNTKFGDMYTYACITNYQTGQSLTTTCQADGKWSVGTTGPTCTPKVCSYSALPTLTNGGPVGIVVNSDTLIGNNVTFSCGSGFRVAPGTAGSTSSTQSIQCQVDGTFTALAQTCVYLYPSSCQDYYTRDNITPGTALTVMIDVDGATTTNSPVSVVCSGRTVGTQSQVCTNVAASSGQTLNIPTTCNQAQLSTLFADTTFVTPNTFGCIEQAVSYPLSAAQITSLISSSNNCEQVVTTPCTAGVGAPTEGRFAGIRRNGETIGTAYDPIGASTTVAGTGVNGRLPIGSCDCGNSDSCTGERACTCTADTGTGSDTITMALSGTQPNFVTNIGIVGRTDGTAALTQVTFATDDFSISVGDIICCSNV